MVRRFKPVVYLSLSNEFLGLGSPASGAGPGKMDVPVLFHDQGTNTSPGIGTMLLPDGRYDGARPGTPPRRYL